jgi:hypothetical protein
MRKKLLFALLAVSNLCLAQWNLSGNSGNTPDNFIGTTDANDFVVKTNNIERMRINPSGNMGIGIAPSPNRALNFWGNIEFNTDTVTRDGYHFFSSGQNVGSGLDLMWLKYVNYQPNDVGLLTLATPQYAGDFPRGVFSVRANGKTFVGLLNYSPTGCTDCNDYRLFVQNGIRTEKVKVDVASANGWADYVFRKNYQLRSLEEVERHIEEEGHLPGVPSADEVVKNGINLGEMDAKLLEKIEELTLYVIQLNKEIKQLKEEKNKTQR